MTAQAKEIIEHRDSLKSERYNFEVRWQEIAELMFPRQAEITTVLQTGANRRLRMLTATAELAGEKFATGLHNLVAGEGRPWFHLRMQDSKLNRRRDVRIWLEAAERDLYAGFNGPQSGFHLALHENWLQLGFFGTGPMAVLDRPGRFPHFLALPLPECLLDRNEFGEVDTLFRSYRKTAKQILQRFPVAQASENVMRAWNSNKSTLFPIIHAIRPRKEAILGSPNALAMPWESVHVLVEDKLILQESGFEEFPVMVPRWLVAANETYGRGPGDRALADTRMLMEVRRSSVKARQMFVDPPWNVPEGSYTHDLRVWPGAINALETGRPGASPLVTVPPGGLGVADQTEAEQKQNIKEAFYNDLFTVEGPIAPDGDVIRMSATESAMRARQQAAEIGPIFSRLKVEKLSPMVFRTLNIRARNGELPPPPEDISEANFEAEYVSPLAVAQQTGDVSTIIEGVQTAGLIESVLPGSVDILKGGTALRRALDALRFPEEATNSQDEVDEIRGRRAERDLRSEELANAQVSASASLDAAKAQEAIRN